MATRPTSLLFALALLATPAGAQDGLFADGFESGSLCPWTTLGETCCGGVVASEAFAGADGAPWPAPWTAAGSVALADLQGGRARLRPTPSGYSLARMVAPILASDVEVTLTLRFENLATQGVGFYVRQNGGYLQQTTPHGQGYAVFVEGFRNPEAIGVWKEEDGNEIPLAIVPTPLDDDVDYRVRFRVVQLDASTTHLAAKIWPATSPEPLAWNVTFEDSTPVLQNLTGGVAVDSWSSLVDPPISAHTLVDDVAITGVCNPLHGAGPLIPRDDTLLFGDGPLWRGDHLLVSDVDADTIYLYSGALRLVFRSPSGHANGLALGAYGTLLACEQANRRLSRDPPSGGAPETLVGSFEGQLLNSPNDLAVRSDGTVYFTDPDYGLPGPRELPFNGLFRLSPGAVFLTAEWQGTPPTNEPNGVALSPDEATLYATDSAQGALLAFAVAPDGALAGPATLASGLTIPDGMCVDREGNLYVATWASTLEVFSPQGAPWGSIPLPDVGTNCAFGDPFGRTLFVTTQSGVYQLDSVFPASR